MNLKRILVVTGDAGQTGLNRWQADPSFYETLYVPSGEAAIELANRQHFDLVVINEALPLTDHRKLDAVLPILIDDVILLRANETGTSDLNEEVRQVFDRRKAERVQRYLVLDSSNGGFWNELPPFSVN